MLYAPKRIQRRKKHATFFGIGQGIEIALPGFLLRSCHGQLLRGGVEVV